MRKTVAASKPETEEQAQNRAFERVRQVRATGAKIALKRYEESIHDYAWVETMPVDDFSEEGVCDKYGGGRYQIFPLKPSGELAGAGATFAIAGAPKPVRPPDPSAATPARTEIDRLIDLLEKRLAAPPVAAAPTKDPIEVAAALVKSMGEAFAGMSKIAQAPAAGGGIGELVTALKDLNDMSRGLREPAAGPSVEGDGAFMWLGPIARVVEKVVDRMDGTPRLPAGDRRPPAPTETARVEVEGPRDAWAEGAKVSTKPMWWPYLARHIPPLVELARADRTPHIYAAAFIDQAPEAAVAFLKDRLTSDEARNALLHELFTHAPETGQYREWFGELVEAMRDILYAPAPEEEPAAGAGGTA